MDTKNKNNIWNILLKTILKVKSSEIKLLDSTFNN